MDKKPKTVLGIYPTRTGVESAVEAFRDAGFRSGDISLVVSEKMNDETLYPDRATKTCEEAAPDHFKVVVIDGPLGWLDELGPAAVRGDGGLLVAGPIAQILECVPPEQSADKLAAALANVGVPKSGTNDYADKVLQGGALLSVHCDSTEAAVTARQLHGDLGGTDVFSTCPVGPDLKSTT
jgi:hypothetical protein